MAFTFFFTIRVGKNVIVVGHFLFFNLSIPAKSLTELTHKKIVRI